MILNATISSFSPSVTCNPNVTSRNIDPWLQEAARMWSVAQGSGGTIHVSRENLAR